MHAFGQLFFSTYELDSSDLAVMSYVIFMRMQLCSLCRIASSGGDTGSSGTPSLRGPRSHLRAAEVCRISNEQTGGHCRHFYKHLSTSKGSLLTARIWKIFWPRRSV